MSLFSLLFFLFFSFSAFTNQVVCADYENDNFDKGSIDTGTGTQAGNITCYDTKGVDRNNYEDLAQSLAKFPTVQNFLRTLNDPEMLKEGSGEGTQ